MNLRIGFFGSFYPYVNRLSSTSVGLVHFLSRSKEVKELVVFSPVGSGLCPGMSKTKVVLDSVWRHDDPVSLVKAMIEVCRKGRELDLVVFNIYLTSFGKKALANGIGILIPIVASLAFETPPVVYMHNFVETQNLGALGYRPTSPGTRIARLLERLIVWRCDVVVPLESQRRQLESHFGRKLRSGIVPYVEAVPGVLSGSSNIRTALAGPNSGLRVLLFGAWGPQKDAEGILRLLSGINQKDLPIVTIVAGGINPNFPSYAKRLDDLHSELGAAAFDLRLGVAETEVAALFRGCDVIILPYTATGGYSAVMNVAAYYGLPILAYDVDELRESASQIGVSCKFFQPGDAVGLRKLLGDIRVQRIHGIFPAEAGPGALEQSAKAAAILVGIPSPEPERQPIAAPSEV